MTRVKDVHIDLRSRSPPVGKSMFGVNASHFFSSTSVLAFLQTAEPPTAEMLISPVSFFGCCVRVRVHGPECFCKCAACFQWFESSGRDCVSEPKLGKFPIYQQQESSLSPQRHSSRH